MKHKGIILAAGAGTRLHPTTSIIAKQLLPIYDKPMIYYPLSTLMLAGIRDILIILSQRDLPLFQALLGKGEQWGINLEYIIQPIPNGIPNAFILGKRFIGSDYPVLILGDNLFYGKTLTCLYHNAMQQTIGATIFTYPVHDPMRYGIVEFDTQGHAITLEEKPEFPRSHYAITGLYFYDPNVVNLVYELKPSTRKELEITDLNRLYLEYNLLKVQHLTANDKWFDAGTPESLLEASQFVSTKQNKHHCMIACLEEIAYTKGWINAEQLEKYALQSSNNAYSQYLIKLLGSNYGQNTK